MERDLDARQQWGTDWGSRGRGCRRDRGYGSGRLGRRGVGWASALVEVFDGNVVAAAIDSNPKVPGHLSVPRNAVFAAAIRALPISSSAFGAGPGPGQPIKTNYAMGAHNRVERSCDHRDVLGRYRLARATATAQYQAYVPDDRQPIGAGPTDRSFRHGEFSPFAVPPTGCSIRPVSG